MEQEIVKLLLTSKKLTITSDIDVLPIFGENGFIGEAKFRVISKETYKGISNGKN